VAQERCRRIGQARRQNRSGQDTTCRDNRGMPRPRAGVVEPLRALTWRTRLARAMRERMDRRGRAGDEPSDKVGRGDAAALPQLLPGRAATPRGVLSRRRALGEKRHAGWASCRAPSASGSRWRRASGAARILLPRRADAGLRHEVAPPGWGGWSRPSRGRGRPPWLLRRTHGGGRAPDAIGGNRRQGRVMGRGEHRAHIIHLAGAEHVAVRAGRRRCEGPD